MLTEESVIALVVVVAVVIMFVACLRCLLDEPEARVSMPNQPERLYFPAADPGPRTLVVPVAVPMAVPMAVVAPVAPRARQPTVPQTPVVAVVQAPPSQPSGPLTVVAGQTETMTVRCQDVRPDSVRPVDQGLPSPRQLASSERHGDRRAPPRMVSVITETMTVQAPAARSEGGLRQRRPRSASADARSDPTPDEQPAETEERPVVARTVRR